MIPKGARQLALSDATLNILWSELVTSDKRRSPKEVILSGAVELGSRSVVALRDYG